MLFCFVMLPLSEYTSAYPTHYLLLRRERTEIVVRSVFTELAFLINVHEINRTSRRLRNRVDGNDWTFSSFESFLSGKKTSVDQTWRLHMTDIRK